MTDEAVTLILTCTAEDITAVREFFANQKADVQASPQRRLDGVSATTWIVAVTVAIRTLPQMINQLRGLLTRNKVHEIKFGDVTITNPRPEDTEKLIEVIRDRCKDA